MEMDDGELVCFIGKKKPFRLTSMDWRRHPQLQKRLGINPPALNPLPPLPDGQPEQTPAPKPPSLSAWHYDPQLFRKWPQVGDDREVGEHAQDVDQANEVSLGV